MLESWVAQEVWAKEEMVEHLFTALEEEEEGIMVEVQECPDLVGATEVEVGGHLLQTQR